MTTKVTMTAGQYKRKTAYHIDPILAESVDIVEPEFFPRHNNETYAVDVLKDIRRTKSWTKNRKIGLFLAVILFAFSATYLGSSNTVEASAPTPITVVYPGERGTEVTMVQQALKNKGYSIIVDGYYGPQTGSVIRKFQQANNLVVDGIVGRQTQTALGITLTHQLRYATNVLTVYPGDRGSHVKLVQQALKNEGYLLSVDGYFGPQTKSVVVNYQTRNGLIVDGIVGGQTQNALGIAIPKSAKSVPAKTTPRRSDIPYTHYYPDVERWHSLALSVGWTEEQWPILSCIMYRESRGQASAKNKNSSATGLLQILASNQPGVDLYNPTTNLTVGLRMYDIRGWQPWVSTAHPCY